MTKQERRTRIHNKLRKTVIGTATRPRLVVYRSLNNVFAQIIDDTAGKTLAQASSLKTKGSLTSKAKSVGEKIAADAKTAKIKAVVFDRAGFAYHGAVKSLCETVRESGVQI